jgi:hypothetical protein
MKNKPKTPDDQGLDFEGVFDAVFPADEVETLAGISTRKLVIDHKREFHNRLRKEAADAVLSALPKPGQAFHIVSNGTFDYWQLVVAACRLLARPVATFRGSTWTTNRQNVRELLGMIDNGTLQSVGMLTGLYFKRRETAVYAALLEGLTSRGQKLRCLENHAKVAVLIAPPDFIVIEGSANFTANPRIEQNVVANCQKLAAFHCEWIDTILNAEE